MSNEPEKITISTEFIRLDALLKFTGSAGTGGEAKYMVQSGQVELNGEICVQRTKKIYPGDRISVNGGGSFLVQGETS